MILASLPSPPVGGFDLGFTEIRVYGILIATAVLVAASWTRRRYAGYGGDPELADRVTIWAVVIAFIGARLAYVTPRLDRFVDDPLSIIQIWEGGLALYGGLTFGLLTLVVLMRRWNGDFPALMDGLAPALPLAQAIGRWGNYFNQELYGTPSDLPWAVEIDNPVAPYEGFGTFHPTFLYESLANLLLVGVILRLERTGRMRRGSLIMVYAIGYGVIRFLLEMIRTDTTFRFLGLSRNAMVSLVFVTAGALVLRWWQGRPPVAAGVDDGDGTGASADGVVDAEPSEASAVLVGVGDAAGLEVGGAESEEHDTGSSHRDGDGDGDGEDADPPAVS
ncbi:MAG TPA: prolipoprotein diacylglyceryl transferase [Euzebya sp.]|nr:prolipoprotein diacylglyceryl transferase [Euzebya sp.]